MTVVVIVVASLGAFALGAGPSSGSMLSTTSSTRSVQTTSTGTRSVSTTVTTATSERNATSLVDFIYSGSFCSQGRLAPPSAGNISWATYICQGGNRSSALVLNCAAAAATPEGCAQTVTYQGSAHQQYVITVWYPFNNTTVSSDGYNAKVDLRAACENGILVTGSCVYTQYMTIQSLNSTAFVVGYVPGTINPVGINV